MKIIILTSENPANVWLVNQILARHEVDGMIIERRPLALTCEEKQDRRRRMVRRYGFARTVNKLLYNWARSRFLAHSEETTIRESFFPGGEPVVYARKVPTLLNENINNAACVEFIKRHMPDILVVCGTSVLQPEVFSLPPKGTVNIHVGITPEYRSADPIFWALYRGEPDKVGVTIHFIDRGIDTGPIILQETVPVYANDSLPKIYARCIRRGNELYLRAIDEIERGTVHPIIRSGVANRAFLSIDKGIVQYFLFHLRFRKLAASLPFEKTVNAQMQTKV